MASVTQMYGIVVSEPLVSGAFCSVSMTLEVTIQGFGRTTIDELCVYEVEDGRIVAEQFFHSVD